MIGSLVELDLDSSGSIYIFHYLVELSSCEIKTHLLSVLGSVILV